MSATVRSSTPWRDPRPATAANEEVRAGPGRARPDAGMGRRSTAAPPDAPVQIVSADIVEIVGRA